MAYKGTPSSWERVGRKQQRKRVKHKDIWSSLDQ